jgi:hypothetical protein
VSSLVFNIVEIHCAVVSTEKMVAVVVFSARLFPLAFLSQEVLPASSPKGQQVQAVLLSLEDAMIADDDVLRLRCAVLRRSATCPAVNSESSIKNR